MKQYRSPKTVIARFVARRTGRGAVLWALVFGVYLASKAIGFVDLYPTAAARQKIAETFSSNVGIELLLGKAPHAATTAAYAAWNTGGIMVIIGAIWALLLATKYFRGEEDAGRQEIFLSGQTTARRAAINIFAGLTVSLSVFYVVMAVLFMAVGRSHGVDFSTGAALFFALTVIVGITLFMMIGALASQLMPTRSRAASLTAVILGVSFLLRALGDVTSAHWLLNITPLGWIEKVQPLADSRPMWLIPVAGLSIVLGLLTIYFAGKRDLGESIIADKATAKPRLGLLNSPFGMALRLNRTSSFGWLSGIFITSLLYGLITKSTAQVFSQSASFTKVIHRLAQQAQLSGALSFLGIVFLLQMIIIMAYAASAVAAIRREEAEGYIDNFLVRQTSRVRWLSGRLCVSIGVIILAAILTTLGVWLGIVGQHLGISIHTLLLASLNAAVPAILTVGVGVLAFGIWPRLTSILAYGVLAWSFLVEMVSSGLKLNHWILDTSVLHQVVLAPAVNPRWSINAIIIGIAIMLCLIGTVLFKRRDLAAE
jgi:ABC-2 type transport system permease protein